MAKIQLVMCDDNNSDLETLRTAADEYIRQRGICGETFCFSSSEEVLRFSENNSASGTTVYLLDVVMPEVDGIDIGRIIRERDKSSTVIYISCSREYTLDAFSVRAFSYLIKPFSREKLFSELDECLNRIETEPQKFTIKTADGVVVLTLSEIVAVEYLNHRLIYHLTNGKKLEGIYRKFPFDNQAEEFMQTGIFLKISASYLVNYKNIQGVRADEFIMCDGSQYKITRKYIAARQQYIKDEMSNK